MIMAPCPTPQSHLSHSYIHHTLSCRTPQATPACPLPSPATQARLLVDINSVAEKVILLKTCYPSADLAKVLMANPKVLKQSKEDLASNAAQVSPAACVLDACVLIHACRSGRCSAQAATRCTSGFGTQQAEACALG
jgi:hypothetical protein